MVLTEGSYACMMDEAGRLPVFIFPSEAEFVIGPSSSGDPNRNRKIFGLYNPFDYPITYKVLATAPDNYEVEENAGTIRSKAKKDIIVRCRRRLEAGTVEKLRFETRKLGEKELLGQRDIALRTVWVASGASSESPSDPRTSDRTSREQRPREPVVRVEPQAQEPGAELEKALAANSRARRFAQDEACERRAFFCYTYTWMAAKGLPFDPPTTLETKCPPCKSELCVDPPSFTPGKFRALIECDPANYFCENFATEGVAAQPICIKPLAFAGEMTGGVEKKHLLLAFNICTREMLAKETCPVDLLSRAPFNPKSVEINPAFYVQCDAGFLVPRAVRRAHETSADPKPVLTCVPSLQVATGLSPTDASRFPKEWHDIRDVTKITYCPAGSTDVEADCVPQPICGEGSVPAELKAMSDAVPVECVEACAYKYQGSRDDYANCQLLDVVDRQDEKDIKVYVLYRQMSGPYTVLMSPEETLKYGRVGPSAATDSAETDTTKPLFRLHREVDPANVDYKFPRCVESKDLKEDQAALVKNDYFLDCDTNPLVAHHPKDISLRAIPRQCADVDSEMEFCTVPAVTLPPTAQDGEDGSKDLKWYLIGGGVGSFVLIVVGFYVYHCTRPRPVEKIIFAKDPRYPQRTSEKDSSADAEAASPASTSESKK
ncbi:unnamed protein product, partial [Mesorhabditis spiculigera]